MTKEKFNWKGLFITEDENSSEDQFDGNNSEKESTTPTTFPKHTPSLATKFTPPATTSNATAVSADILNSVLEMYESGFESLNKPGYDFYEFFKAIKAVESNDPSVYKMAMTMAQSVDNKITKSSLLTEANFYVQEIEKVHQHYVNQGNSKKSNILNSQKTKKDKLAKEVSELEKQLLALQNQISDKKNQLQSTDVELMTEVSKIDQKIIANDAARSKILETINVVIEGLKNNL